MTPLEPSAWLLLAFSLLPMAIAARLGNVLERAPALVATQIGLAAWGVAEAVTELTSGGGSWLPRALAIAVPALLWTGAAQWRDVRRPWGMPAIVCAAALLATGLAEAEPALDVATRGAVIRGVVFVHAGLAGCAALRNLMHEGVTRGRVQEMLLWLTCVGPPLLSALADASGRTSSPALHPLAYAPLSLALAWLFRTQGVGIAGMRELEEPLIILDGKGRVIDGNAAAFALLGAPGHSPRSLQGQVVGIPGLRRLLEDPSRECSEFFTGSSAETRRCHEARVIRRPGDTTGARVLAIQDVTARREAERQLLHQARFDSLTGLANRRFFLDRLELALAAARSSGSIVAVMYIDLDRFKSINDSYGHAAGDELLRIMAHRLRQSLRGTEVAAMVQDTSLARLGGDEFALLMPSLEGAEQAARVAVRLLAVLTEPVLLEGNRVWNAGSVGIALYPEHASDVESLLRAADVALYHAKAHRRGGYQIFEPALTEGTQRRAAIDRRLRAALASNALAVHYQAKYGMRDRKLVGGEALLRWEDAELGAVGPKEFIPVAEETGLIGPLGDWVIETVCTALARWRSEGRAIVPVSVNVSSKQFVQADMSRVVADALDRHGIDPHWLEIELTESSILENDERTASCLRTLRAIGVRISLDDFGTGYSSLSYLNRVPLDVLKMDRNFVRDIHLDPGAEGVVAAVVSMAHSLKLEVVAEGVDCEEQIEVLIRTGCDAVQGFAFGSAMPERAFAQLLGPAAPRGEAEPEEEALLPAFHAKEGSRGASPLPRIAAAPVAVAPAAEPARRREEDPKRAPRALVVDDGSGRLGVLAMRLNRIGVTALYASVPDEGLLFAAEDGAPIRALLARSDAEPEGVLRLVERIAASFVQAPAILLVGEGDVPKSLLDLRSRCRIWTLREPLDDAQLRDVIRSGLYGSPPGAARREHPRAPFDLMATVAVGDRSEAAVLSSLSLRGAFLELRQRPPVGMRVDVAFQLEDVSSRAQATVLYVVDEAPGSGPPGIGVLFDDLAPEISSAIQASVEQRAVCCLA